MRLAVYSTMFGPPWGGSEELWSRAASMLLARGHQVAVNYKRRKAAVPQLERLAEQGAAIYYRRGPSMGRAMRRLMRRVGVGQQPHRAWLEAARPDFVLVSMGYHVDDIAIAGTCRQLGIPYGLLLQAASPYQWLESNQQEIHRDAYAGAARRYFVSDENRRTIESNLALDLSDATIVDNPFNVAVNAAPAWPAAVEPWKLACVARLQFQAKGQDVLLQVMRQPKWRSRAIEVTLWGHDGGSRRQIERLIALFGLDRHVKFGGFADSIESLWAEHHALVMPSRFEGNPLAMIEAMMCGRVAIVTNVGRAAELIDDNRTGFIAPAATVEAVDEALERAWQRRHDWQAMGALAAQSIRERHSLTPAEDFAEALVAESELRTAKLSRAA
jgi:glycosyltransferase involved in cell wall biosynthesis